MSERSQPLRVGIVGCGVVGAAIAYELSCHSGLQITVIDQRSPQTWQATGAALGVLIGALSRKRRGRHLQLRLDSLRRYETLIPELEALTQTAIPYNRQGILQLCFAEADLQQWYELANLRQQSGWPLEVWSLEELAHHYPYLVQAREIASAQAVVGAIYAAGDRQVDPVQLTQAFIRAAQQQGVSFHWQTTVTDFVRQQSQVVALQTQAGQLPLDYLVLAAGLGSLTLTQQLQQPVALQPVLGQALRLRRSSLLQTPQPVIQGADVHLVPLSQAELWVGATVEFPADEAAIAPAADPDRLTAVLNQAIALDPTLATAQVLHTWSGLRPRPQGQPAPVIMPLETYTNVLVATGHYRNGILLAPITAEKVWHWLSTSTDR